MIITMASKATALRSALFLAVIAIAAQGSDSYNVTQGSDDAETCVYSVYVRTGDKLFSGTDSTITLAVGDAEGSKFTVSDLVSWGGLMGPDHDYFETGNLDIFSGQGPCLNGPICSLDLLSSGTGGNPAWYCDYVQVASTGLHISCNKKNFVVDQWFSTDEPPYQLSFSVDRCTSSSPAAAVALSEKM